MFSTVLPNCSVIRMLTGIVVYQNVMVSTCYHNKSSHMYSRASNTQCHTHTHSYQVIHQLIGTNNAQILRQTVRAEKAEPAPALQLYHLARPAYFLPYPGPQPAPPRGYQPTGARSSARTELVWPAPPRGPKPAPRRALMCI